MLSKIQKNVLTELVNTFVGGAAGTLSEMVNEKVILSIPDVELVTVSDFQQLDAKGKNLINSDHIISSSINFGEDFNGKAFLIFSAEQAKQLVNTCIGKQMPLDYSSSNINFIDTDFDVLKEISNVILNTLIGDFGNLIGLKLEYTLPEIELIFVTDSEKQILSQGNVYIFVIRITFLLSKTQIRGTILIALSLNSVTLLIEKINELIGEING